MSEETKDYTYRKIEVKKKTIFVSNDYFYSLKNKAPPLLFV